MRYNDNIVDISPWRVGHVPCWLPREAQTTVHCTLLQRSQYWPIQITCTGRKITTTALSFRGVDIDLYRLKKSDNFAYIFWTKAATVKYLREECWSSDKLQLSFKYFANLYFISKLSSKISKKQTTFFQLFSCFKLCLCEKKYVSLWVIEWWVHIHKISTPKCIFGDADFSVIHKSNLYKSVSANTRILVRTSFINFQKYKSLLTLFCLHQRPPLTKWYLLWQTNLTERKWKGSNSLARWMYWTMNKLDWNDSNSYIHS